MLDPKYFMKGIKKMCTLYNKDKTEQECMLYYDYFKDYTNEQFKFIVEECVKQYTWFPSVAQMLETINNLQTTSNDKAREFESLLFKYDTDTTIKILKKRNDIIGVKVLENNYKVLRELQQTDVNIMKSQLREQYKALSNRQEKEQKIKTNNLQLDNLVKMIEE